MTHLCAKCAKPLMSYYRVQRVDGGGNITVSADTCSIPCLIQWSMNYAAMLGTMGAMKVKSVLDQALDILRGVKPKP